MPSERKVCAAIEYVSGNRADGDLGAEEGKLAVFEDAGHECVSLGSDVQANPQKSQLRIEQVEYEQQTAFGELTHGHLGTNVVKLRSYYAETPGADWRRGFLTSREERDSFLC